MEKSGVDQCFNELKEFLESLLSLDLQALKEYRPLLQTLIVGCSVPRECIFFLFKCLTTKKGFIYLTNLFSSVSTTMGSLLGVESNLPENFKLEVEAMKEKREEMNEKIKEILESIAEITKACDGRNGQQFSVEENNQMDLKLIDLEGKLAELEVILKRAQETLEEVEWKTREWIFTSFAGLFLTPFLLFKGSGWVAAKMFGAYEHLFGGAGLVTGLGINYLYWLQTLSDHSLQLKKCKEIESKLKSLEDKFEKAKIKFDNCKKKVKKLS